MIKSVVLLCVVCMTPPLCSEEERLEAVLESDPSVLIMVLAAMTKSEVRVSVVMVNKVVVSNR